MSDSLKKIRNLYDSRSAYGEYSTLAPSSKGNLKSRYIATVFDQALIPLVKQLRETDLLLDYGCGTGIFIKKIENFPANTIGTDISFEMLRIAQNLVSSSSNASLFMTDGKSIPFRQHVFDCILAREVLCHVPDSILPTLLQELYKSLKQGGKFILLDQVSESTKWQEYPKTPLIKKRSVKQILDMFQGVGFTVQDYYVVRRPRFFWIYLFQFKLLPRILLSPLAKTELYINRKFSAVLTHRWHDVLFEFYK